MDRSRVVTVVLSIGGVLVAMMGGFVFVTFLACCLGGMLADRGLGGYVPVAVSGHRWTRAVAVEERQLEVDSDWCADLPAEARVLATSTKERSVRGKKRREAWCNYEALVWRETEEKELSGRGPDERGVNLGEPPA